MQPKDSDLQKVLTNALAPLYAPSLGLVVGIVSGITLLLATVTLLLKGRGSVGPHLSLLAQYFWAYEMSWSGVFIGFVQAGLWGFCLGSTFAKATKFRDLTHTHLKSNTVLTKTAFHCL